MAGLFPEPPGDLSPKLAADHARGFGPCDGNRHPGFHPHPGGRHRRGILSGPLMDRFGPYPVLAVLYLSGTVFVALIGLAATSLAAIIAITSARALGERRTKERERAGGDILSNGGAFNRRRLGARCRSHWLDHRTPPGWLADGAWLVQRQHLRVRFTAYVVRRAGCLRHGTALWLES